MDLKKIKDLIDLMEKRNLAEIEIEEGKKRIHLRRTGTNELAVVAPPAMGGAVTVLKSAAAPVKVAVSGHVIKSPLVGTFYTSPSPTEPPYAKPGQAVKKGQVLCIVEAMKLMNEIESDIDGVIREVLVKNGQPVEFDEPLFRIDPAG